MCFSRFCFVFLSHACPNVGYDKICANNGQVRVWFDRDFGLVLFSLIAFFICYVVFDMSFSGQSKWKSVSLSLLCTAVALMFAIQARLEFMLPALFGVSHLVSCVAALLSKSPLFTQTVGWSFLVASIMGILEMTQCETIYRSLGGHVLYDFWLNFTVLLCLPPFAPPPAPLTIKSNTE